MAPWAWGTAFPHRPAALRGSLCRVAGSPEPVPPGGVAGSLFLGMSDRRVRPQTSPQERRPLLIKGGLGPGWVWRRETSQGLKAKSSRNPEAATHRLCIATVSTTAGCPSRSVIASGPRTFRHSRGCESPGVALESRGRWARPPTGPVLCTPAPCSPLPLNGHFEKTFVTGNLTLMCRRALKCHQFKGTHCLWGFN